MAAGILKNALGTYENSHYQNPSPEG